MRPFVIGIHFDLTSRVNKMLSKLKAGGFDADIPDDFLEKTISLLEGLLNDIENVVSSGDLEIEFLTSNNLIRYNTFHQRFQQIELYRYRVIVSYGKPEKYFNNKIKRIYDEINNLQSPPLITTISNSEDYYWAHPWYEIIALPFGEEESLLNLPDIYHEIGHLIYKQYSNSLIASIEDQIKNYYQEQRQMVLDHNKSPELISVFNELESNWLSGWLEEFTCDVIATYLVGEAYVWTNMKITAISGADNAIYQPSISHPSDESRNRAIILALRFLNFDGIDVDSIQISWDDFLAQMSNDEPLYYSYYFPNDILNVLVSKVIEGCRDILLIDYQAQSLADITPISIYLNQAWKLNRENPDLFSDWESEKIKEISDSF